MPNIMARIPLAELEKTGIPIHFGPPDEGEPQIIGIGEQVVSLEGGICAVLDYFGGHHPGLAAPHIGGKTPVESRRWRVIRESDLFNLILTNNGRRTT